MIFGNYAVELLLILIVMVAYIGNHQYQRECLIKKIHQMSFHEVMYMILQPPARGFHHEVRDALLRQGAKEISIFSAPDAVRAFYRYAQQHPVTEVVAIVEKKVPKLLAA